LASEDDGYGIDNFHNIFNPLPPYFDPQSKKLLRAGSRGGRGGSAGNTLVDAPTTIYGAGSDGEGKYRPDGCDNVGYGNLAADLSNAWAKASQVSLAGGLTALLLSIGGDSEVGIGQLAFAGVTGVAAGTSQFVAGLLQSIGGQTNPNMGRALFAMTPGAALHAGSRWARHTGFRSAAERAEDRALSKLTTATGTSFDVATAAFDIGATRVSCPE
jgi:hypothetical protein